MISFSFLSKNKNEIRHEIENQDLWLLDIKHTRAIGHLVSESFAYLAEVALNLRTKKNVVILLNQEIVEHDYFLQYLPENFYIVTLKNDEEYRGLRGVFYSCCHVLSTWDYVMNDNKSGDHMKLFSLLRGKTLCKLTADDNQILNDYKKKEGINVDDWFVAFHTRHSNKKRNQDRYGAHDFRNTDDSSYGLLANEIKKLGGHLIRLGDPVPFDYGPDIINYPNSKFKSQRMDIILSASCKFFLGCSSGLRFIPAIFGVPSAVCNLTLHDAGYLHSDIVLFKHVKNLKTGNVIPLQELLQSQLFYKLNFFDKFPDWDKKIKFVSNSAKEICRFGLEMLHYQTQKGKDDFYRLIPTRFLYQPGGYAYFTESRLSSMYGRLEKPLKDI